MICKIHKAYRYVVAICDKGLLGKKFGEGKKVLEITKDFYEGDIINEQEAIKIIQDMSQEDATFNVVGEKSVNVALKCGLIKKQGIKKVEGVPFALVLL